MNNLGNLETAIYIINFDYHLVHFNEVLRKSFPKAKYGDLCYEILCQETAPCKECPLTKEIKNGTIFYNKLINRWLDITTGMIDWPGAGTCNIIFTRRINEGNKNLFYSMMSGSAYDELFELNVTKDSYRILYQQQEKYIAPDENGQLSRMITEVCSNMIHPDDKDVFQNFWNLEDILSRLIQNHTATARKGQFRKMRNDGTYCWVLQTLVPIRYEEADDIIVMCFTQDIHEQKIKEEALQKQLAKQNDSFDDLTGLCKRNYFFQQAEIFLNQHQEECCLMAIDIEHFKLFNEWYGQDAGDNILIKIAEYLQKKIKTVGGGLACYMGADDFVILVPRQAELLSDLQNQIMKYMNQYGNNAGFLPAFGLYAITDRTLPVSTMYDRATIALASVKGNYARRVCWYDTKMMEKMEEGHVLLSDFQKALENNEFTFYAQPKCNMATGKIIGLESLVRWKHPLRGMISPKDFIPLLEQNGFITRLDLHIWDKVCAAVRNWMNQGHKAIPISVNVSRVDLFTLDIVKIFNNLIHKYELPPQLIEIEITESAYVEEYQMISNVVEALRKAGFTVLMDDFGSGYSSLNMLKDVNVDILKIDMKFLEMNETSIGKGVGILDAITSMARLMGLRVIAEGVETQEQVDFLLDMGCLYGQGYFFYTPMPVHDLEPLLANESHIDFKGIQTRPIEQLRIKELLDENLFSETMINHILGGIAFYEIYHDAIRLLRVNEQYYKIIGTDAAELETQKNSILNLIYKEDQAVALEIFRHAQHNILNGAEGDIRRLRKDGSSIWMHLRVYFLKEQDGRKLYYGAISDVTVQKRKEQQLESSQRALSAVVHISANDESFMKLGEENRRIAASIFAQMSPGGMIGGYCEEDFPLYFANHEMVKLLGYESYDEFYEAIDGKVIHTIHPDDRERVRQDIGEYYPGLEYVTTYRMPKKNGTWFWTLDKGKIILAEDGRLAIVSACTDISETMMAQEQLAERNALLSRKNQELQFLNNDMPGGYHRCAKTPDYDFLYISDRFLEIFGYTREEIKTIFENKFIQMVHPADRQLVKEGVAYLQKTDHMHTLEYRMKSKKGYIWVIDQSRYMVYENKTFLQGIILDVTETVNLRNKMQLLMDYAPESFVLVTYHNHQKQYKVIINGLFQKLGYPLEEYEHLLNINHFPVTLSPEDCTRLKEKMTNAIQSRQDYHDLIQISLPNQQHLWLQLDAYYIKEEQDGVTYLHIYHEVTPKRIRSSEQTENPNEIQLH